MTQQQAEEQCRLLRMKRNAATQDADAIYQKTIQTLFDTYTEESKRLDNKIIEVKKQIADVRVRMSQAWDKAEAYRKAKGEERPCMGTIVAPFKLQISELEAEFCTLRNERKYLTQQYEHNRRVAVGIRDNIIREAREHFLFERMSIMEHVATKQPEYWKQKYEELKKQVEGAA